MLRFLEKHRKSSKKSVPPENPAHQTADIGAEYGRGPEGEYRSRNTSADKASGTDSTTESDNNRGGDSQIANQDGRIENQQLPASSTSTLTPEHEGGNTSECDRLQLLGSVFIPCSDSTAKTGANTWGLCGSAERATQYSQHP